MDQPVRRLSPNEERLIIAVDRAIYRVARRWIWLLNAVGLAFVALPILVPYLMAAGHAGPAAWIYRVFSLICHQRPDRSFFLSGYQMAYCQRNFAIYTGLFLLGLLFALVRHRVRPLGLRGAVLLSIPMALDGFTQLVGLRESTWELRLLTGGLFALGVAWLVYPRLEIGFAEIRRMLESRFARLVREGRARPL